MTVRPVEADPSSLPPAMQRVREAALKAVGALEPAGAPKSQIEAKGLLLSSRTDGGRDLPPYYLVYFLLVDLLGFSNLGQWEKVAWTVPVRYCGRLYGIEHRKMGLGIFAPNLDPNARMSTAPSEEADADAREIAVLIKKGVAAAEPYFEWRAEQAAAGVQLNVVNNSDWLFDRYEFFRDRFEALSAEAELRKNERDIKKEALESAQIIVVHDVEHIFILAEMLVSPVQRGVRGNDSDVVLSQKSFADTLRIGDRNGKLSLVDRQEHAHCLYHSADRFASQLNLETLFPV